MPDRKTARLVGIEGAALPFLEAELRRLDYAIGGDSPALAFVGVADARDEDRLLAISSAGCPVIAILDPHQSSLARAAAVAGARGILDLPLRRSALAAQIALATVASAHFERLESKVALLERTLKSRRAIEKASQVLATVRGVTQADAYEFLRKSAMRRRVTMVETALDYLATIEASVVD